ncbi:MAG: homoaconitase [Terriglobales bacterium]
MMSQTIVEKLAQAHKVEGPDRPWRAGDFVSIRPRYVMTHDNSSAVIKKFQSIGATLIHNPRQLVFALDHDIQNQSEENQGKYRKIEAFARQHDIDFYAAGTGIGHQIMVQEGYVTPGSFVVASDSHSNMYGALAAIGTPIVRTDAAAVWATGEFWWQIPQTVQVVLKGELPPGAAGKDVIITLCGLYNQEEVLNAAVEFTGPGVTTLSMDARLSIANMSTEWGALVGWFPCDEVTISYMRDVYERLKAQGIERFTETDLARWGSDPPHPDPDAQYAASITLDLSEVTPHLSGPDTVQVMQSVAAIQPRKVAIQKAYLVSCVNSRLEDLKAAANVLEGKKVAGTVKFYLAAASRAVQEEAERRGIWQTIVSSGAITLPPGCGPCIGLGTGLLEPGEVGISATNRNFKGRMGSKEAQCYLASPAVVAASAVAGYIAGPGSAAASAAGPARHFEDLSATTKVEAEQVAILPGFPPLVRGRMVFIPRNNLNTDGIYAGKYTYDDKINPERMAEVIFDNYDSQLAARVKAGDILVGGFNFGTGSSREQAATALKAIGIPLVIAGSFSQTYLRNAFNNGLLCLEVPALVNRLREQFAVEMKAGEKGIIPGDEIAIDFTRGTLTWRGEEFAFPALGTVPQSLIIAGGVENLVSRKLGLASKA